MISDMKDEPQWMREFRLRSLELFYQKEDPRLGQRGAEGTSTSTTSTTSCGRRTATSAHGTTCPEYIRNTFDKLGIPEAEKKYLAGVGAQYDSEVVYHNIREDLEKLGVIFLGTDQALREHEDIFKEYFGTIVPPGDNRYAALEQRRLVRRVVHLRAQGREGRHPAAGLLPHQHARTWASSSGR